MFYDSIETAIAASLREEKPLLVLVETARAAETSSWAKELVQECQSQVAEKTVPLLVFEGTQAFVYFDQLFKVAKVPSLFLIRGPLVLGKIEQPVSADEFQRLITSVSAAGSGSGSGSGGDSRAGDSETAPAQSHEVASATANVSTTTEEALQQSDAPQSLTDSTALPNRQTTSSRSRNSTPTPASQDAAARTPRVTVQQQQPSATPEPRSTSDTERYHQELRKQRQAEAEERKRILRMVEADKAERRHRRMSSYGSTPPPVSRAPPKESRAMSNSTEVALQIRLFDGTAVKHRFSAEASLADVRDWLDKNRSDGSDAYVFFRNMPRTTFDETQEQKSLRELGLWPSSTLIMRPVPNAATAYASASNSATSWLGYGAQKISDTLYSLFGGGYDPREANTSDSEREHDDFHNVPQGRDSRTTYNGNQTNLEDTNRRR